MPGRDLPLKNAGLKGADEARWLHLSTERVREGGGRRERPKPKMREREREGKRGGEKKETSSLKGHGLSAAPSPCLLRLFSSRLVRTPSLIWVRPFHVEWQWGSIGLVSENSPNTFAASLLRSKWQQDGEGEDGGWREAGRWDGVGEKREKETVGCRGKYVFFYSNVGWEQCKKKKKAILHIFVHWWGKEERRDKQDESNRKPSNLQTENTM